VSIFQEVSACHAANYRYFGDWQELTAEQQAFLIAHYLLGIVVSNHQQDAEAQAIERASKKKKRT